MKKLFNFVKKKIIEFFSWIWHECKDWRTFVLLVIVCFVIGFPVWGGYLIGMLTGWEWAYWMASALLAFWWLPGAPYFAVCVAVTLAIKRFFEKRQEKHAKAEKDNSGGNRSDSSEISDEPINDNE